MREQLQDVCSTLGCDSSYAQEVLEKLRNDEWVSVHDYAEFRIVKELAAVEGLKVRYKEQTGRVVVQKSY